LLHDDREQTVYARHARFSFARTSQAVHREGPAALTPGRGP
jgi:hypothetical protein